MTRNILITGASRGIGAATMVAIRPEQARVLGHASSDRDGFLGADLAEPGAGRVISASARSASFGSIA